MPCPIYRPLHHDSYFEQCFDVISLIGEGSFSEVFKVRSKKDGCLYAIKKSKVPYKSETYRRVRTIIKNYFHFFMFSFCEFLQYKQERLEEVRRYEQLSKHEHCLTLYYAWEEDNRLYMQLELCQDSLESFLRKRKCLPESMVWNVVVDLLLVCDYFYV